MTILRLDEQIDHKPEVFAYDEHQAELKPDDPTEVGLAALQGEGLLKSRFDELPLLRTVWVFRWSVIYCFSIYTLGMIEGWELGVSGSVIVNKGFVQTFSTVPDQKGVLGLDPSWVSAWGASINVGQFFAIGFCSYIANRWGRKATFYICWSCYVIGLLFLTLGKTPALWFIGKLFTGIACGTQQLTTTPYVVEIAPNRVRGALGTFSAVWGAFGGIICNLMLKIANDKYPYNYHIPLYVVWGLAAIMLFCVIIVPESPWYHARRGNKDKCMKSLRRVFGTVKGFDFEEEYGIIVRTLSHERAILESERATSYKDLFVGINLRRTLIVTIWEVGSLLVGLALISTYSTYFFELAGQSDPFLSSLIVSIIQLGAILAYSLVIDKVGRRYPVSIAYSIACLCVWLMGVLFYVKTSGAKTALLVITCIWSSCFVITSNTYWLVAAELPSAHLRIKTGSCGLFFGACFGIITCFAVPRMLSALNLRSGFIFGAASLPVAVFFWFFLPETKGRAAAEIDELFERKIPAWRWSKTTTVIEEQMTAAAAARRGEIQA